MAKEKLKGLKDPLFKWDAAIESLAEASEPLLQARAGLQELNSQLAKPGLGRQERQLLLKTIAKQKADIRKLDAEARRNMAGSLDQRRMQLEIVYKLNALRQESRKSSIDATLKANLQTNEKALEELLVLTNTLSVDSLPEILAKVRSTQESLTGLPDVIGNALAKSDASLDEMLLRQKEAAEFLKGQRDQIKKLGSDLKKELVNTGIRLVDKIGIGPFTLGNAARALGAAYRGGKYAVKTIKAIKDSRLKPEGSTSLPSTENDDDKFKTKLLDYLSHTRLFQRRMLRAAEKKQSDASPGLFSLLPSIKGLMSNVGQLFGKGGVVGSLLATLGGVLGGKVLPVLGSLLKGGLRILGPLGALATAFGAGHWVGEQLNKVVQEPIAKALDYLLIKNADTGKTGLETTVDTAKAKAVNLANDARAGASSVAATVASTASSTADSVSKAASSAVTSVSNTARDAATTVANSSAGQLVSRGVNAAIEGGSAVKDWVGKVFSKAGGVDVDGLNPAMQKNMVAMAKEYYEKTGKRLNLNSAYRSFAKQAELYRTLPKGKAAPPGRSLHELGLAFDTDSSQGNELAKLGLLSKYGFERPIAKEPWHVQPKGLTYDTAKAGMYSADGPANQPSASSRPLDTSITTTEAKVAVNTKQNMTGRPDAGTSSTRAAQPSSKVGVNDIPTFDSSDGQFLALNLGVLS